MLSGQGIPIVESQKNREKWRDIEPEEVGLD
jgi:hypothetical protein